MVRLAGDPLVYAEAILNVCKLYIESPLVWVSGVTGASLKKRIAEIMAGRMVHNLSYGKRILLAAAGLAALTGPVGIGILRAPALAAQNATNQQKFEVASVKRTDRCFAGRNSIDPGSVTFRGVPLKPLLMEAFKVKVDQIEGPSWLETDCFEISAKIPEGVPSDQLSTMLQALLTERFKLVAHKEDRLRPGYALVVDKGGPKFKEDDPNTNFMGRNAGKMFYGALGHGAVKGVMSMAALAANLSNEGYGPVPDLTGLTGKYDIDLSWTRDPDFAPRPRDPAASAATPPSADKPAAPGTDLFAALRDQLGLKLERRQTQVQFLIIDRIERIPTEN